MRWKLLVIVSLVTTLIAFCTWELSISLLFGSIRPIHSESRLLPATFAIPIIISLLGGLFVYRHTARRRKTQALIGVLLSLILTGGIYLGAARLFPRRLSISKAFAAITHRHSFGPNPISFCRGLSASITKRT